MTYFTDSTYGKMMVQKPQHSSASTKNRPPEKEQKVRKLIIVNEKTDTPKPHNEG